MEVVAGKFKNSSPKLCFIYLELCWNYLSLPHCLQLTYFTIMEVIRLWEQLLLDKDRERTEQERVNVQKGKRIENVDWRTEGTYDIETENEQDCERQRRHLTKMMDMEGKIRIRKTKRLRREDRETRIKISVTRKNRQMSIKVAQKQFHSKNDRFWHLNKNCITMWEIWAY